MIAECNVVYCLFLLLLHHGNPFVLFILLAHTGCTQLLTDCPLLPRAYPIAIFIWSYSFSRIVRVVLFALRCRLIHHNTFAIQRGHTLIKRNRDYHIIDWFRLYSFIIIHVLKLRRYETCRLSSSLRRAPNPNRISLLSIAHSVHHFDGLKLMKLAHAHWWRNRHYTCYAIWLLCNLKSQCAGVHRIGLTVNGFSKLFFAVQYRTVILILIRVSFVWHIWWSKYLLSQSEQSVLAVLWSHQYANIYNKQASHVTSKNDTQRKCQTTAMVCRAVWTLLLKIITAATRIM